VTDTKEQKQVGKSFAYVELVAGNLLCVLKGDGKAGLKEYKGTFEAIFITNGKVSLFSFLVIAFSTLY
jgi:hypothetical protein